MQPIAIRYSGRLRLPARGRPCGRTAQNELGVETELIVGDRSEFSVWVNDKVILKRETRLRFPKIRKCLRPSARRSKARENE
jgi:hypothetical protein